MKQQNGAEHALRYEYNYQRYGIGCIANLENQKCTPGGQVQCLT